MDTRSQFIQNMLGKPVHAEVDRPVGYLHGDIQYPVNYGFIPGLIAGDGEEQDVYILGVPEPISSFDGYVIGGIRRKDDAEDKLVAAPKGMRFHQAEIAAAVRFQEQYFDSHVIALFQKSCGVLPYRYVSGVREYLLVFEQFSQCWSLPKGRMEAGETEAQAALRELLEETGLTARLDISRRAVVEYAISPPGRKQVVFFPGEVCGSPRIRPGEIDRFQWVRKEELKDYLFPDVAEACEPLLI